MHMSQEWTETERLHMIAYLATHLRTWLRGGWSEAACWDASDRIALLATLPAAQLEANRAHLLAGTPYASGA